MLMDLEGAQILSLYSHNDTRTLATINNIVRYNICTLASKKGLMLSDCSNTYIPLWIIMPHVQIRNAKISYQNFGVAKKIT